VRGTEWYPRLAAVLGINYPGSPDVERSRLATANVTPQIRRYQSVDGDDLPDSLWWAYGETESSQSPAAARAAALSGDYESWVRAAQEAVELPGTPSDYHFILQGCVDTIWLRHRREPGALALFELFAWADLRLVAAHRTWFEFDKPDGGTGYYRIGTIDRLLGMLSREGAWRAALEVVEVAVTLRQGQAEKRRDDLAACVAFLDAEVEA